jgi:undecaprenyl-diphosphatase
MLSSLLTIPEAILLGIVEGITEFLPISSTGHLLVVGDLIGFGTGESQSAADAYSITIQLGAIVAVLFLFRLRVTSLTKGLVGRDSEGRDILVALLLSFLPAAVLGVLFGDAIKDTLFGPIPITIAWAVGGILLLVWKPTAAGYDIQQLTTQSALVIGVAQCVAMWPGVSRSLATLIAGLAVGLSLSAAVEYSFLLGVITLAAATALDLLQYGDDIVQQFGILRPVIGGVVAFLTALVAVKWMINYLANRSLAIFGWYRLAIAAMSTVLLVTGVL